MRFDIQIAYGVQEIDQASWDHMGEGRPFTSYRWYRFAQAVLADEAPIYVILSYAGEPVARATIQVIRHEPIEVPVILAERGIAFLLRRWPLLSCRTPLANRSGLILPDDPQLRAVALQRMSEVMLELGQHHRASFMAFDYLGPQAMGWPWMAPFMQVQIPEPGTCLDLTPWSTFDEYLSHLSKKRRYWYRRHWKYADENRVEIKLYPEVKDVEAAMALIHNVEEKYDEPPVPWTRRLLENAGMVDAVWIAAEVDGRLVGCELLVGDRGGWRVIGLGRDYAYDNVYYLLGYTDIRHAIESGGEILYWGTCAYQVKKMLGFALEMNQYLAVATHNRALGWLTRKLVGRYYNVSRAVTADDVVNVD